MPRVTLDACPACRYDLRGLPTRYRCPECGFEYDEQTTIWRPRLRRRAYLWGPLCAMLVVGLVTRGDRLLRYHSIARDDLLVFLVSGLGLACTLLWLSYLRNVSSFVALTRRGIHARNYRGRLFVPWDRLQGVSGSLGIPAVYRIGKSVAFELDGIFETRREIDEFYAELRRARAAGGYSPPDVRLP